MSNQDPSSTPNERKRHTDQNVRPISDRAMAIFFAILVAIVVLGYLLMTKLADDRRELHDGAPQKLRRNRMALTRAALRGHRLTVRVWHKCEVPTESSKCPLSGATRKTFARNEFFSV